MAGPEQNRLKLTDDQKKDVLALQKAIDVQFRQSADRGTKASDQERLRPIRPSAGGGGPAAGPGDPQQPGKIFSATQQDTLKLSAGQKKRLEEIQKELDTQARDIAHGGPETAAPNDAARAAGGGGPFRNGPPGGRPLFRAVRYADQTSPDSQART